MHGRRVMCPMIFPKCNVPFLCEPYRRLEDISHSELAASKSLDRVDPCGRATYAAAFSTHTPCWPDARDHRKLDTHLAQSQS